MLRGPGILPSCLPQKPSKPAGFITACSIYMQAGWSCLLEKTQQPYAEQFPFALGERQGRIQQGKGCKAAPTRKKERKENELPQTSVLKQAFKDPNT